jgi:hypothetical protein
MARVATDRDDVAYCNPSLMTTSIIVSLHCPGLLHASHSFPSKFQALSHAIASRLTCGTILISIVIEMYKNMSILSGPSKALGLLFQQIDKRTVVADKSRKQWQHKSMASSNE